MLEGFDLKAWGDQAGEDIGGAVNKAGEDIAAAAEEEKKKAEANAIKGAKNMSEVVIEDNLGMDTDTLNNMAGKANAATIDCTGNSVKEQKAAILKAEMNKKQAELNDLNDSLADAEKNYYMFSEGGYLYDERLLSDETKNANKERERLLNKHNKVTQEIFLYLDTNKMNNTGNMQDLLAFYKRKNSNFKKAIDEYFKITETNDRKTYYDKKNIDFQQVIKIVVIIIYVLIIIYYIAIIFVLNKDFKNLKAWAFLIIFILLPTLLLPFIIDFIHTHFFLNISENKELKSGYGLIKLLTKLETLLLV
jgi:hypothetical protein